MAAAGLLMAGFAWAQGPLTPPGAPGETMKTLAQVEPRTSITNLPFSITTGGSYYLAAALAGGESDNGIGIEADNVTLDLMGFPLQGGGAGSGDGIYVSGAHRGIVIRNGLVSGWGQCGVRTDEGSVCQVADLVAVSNGSYGISIGEASQAERCTADFNQGGIRAAGAQALVRDCFTRRNLANGIDADLGAFIERCTSYSNTVHGIACGADCLIRANRCIGNGHDSGYGAAIAASGTSNHIERNELVGNYRGLDVQPMPHYIVDNVVEQNLDNYSINMGAIVSTDSVRRLLISELPVTVGHNCHLQVTRDLYAPPGVNGITVGNDVVIDLDGHTLYGGANSGCGIIEDVTADRVCVKNGTLRNWLGAGQAAIQVEGTQTTVENVSIYHAYNGIRAGYGARVRNCFISEAEGLGVQATHESFVESCRILTVQGNGIVVGGNSQVKSCDVAGSVSVGTGIITGDHGLVLDCAVYNTTTGIVVGAYSVVERSAVSLHIKGPGILCGERSVIRGNRVTEGGSEWDEETFYADGIIIQGGGALVVDNYVADHNRYGVDSGPNRVALFRNIATSNALGNYVVPITDGVAPNGIPSTTVNPWANLNYSLP